MNKYVKVLSTLIGLGVCYYLIHTIGFGGLTEGLSNKESVQNGRVDLTPIDGKDLLLLDGMEDFVSITLIGYAILDTAKHVQVYVMFKSTYEHDVILKGFDKNGIEICRSAYYLSGKRSESTYHDFVFNIAAPINLAAYFSVEKFK